MGEISSDAKRLMMQHRNRRAEQVFQRGDYIIVMQDDRRAFRVAKVLRISRARNGYIVKYWRWAEGRWSGDVHAMPGQVLCELPDGARRKEDVALNLLALANMRDYAIRQADQDMVAGVARYIGIGVL